MAVPLSNIHHVAALLNGYSWTGTAGQGVLLTWRPGTSGSGALDGELADVRPLTSGQTAALATALAKYSAVANVEFRLAGASEKADIVVSQARSVESSGWLGESQQTLGFSAAGLRDQITHSDVWLSASRGANPEPGTLFFKTLLHEVGHALGLKHPHDDGYGGHNDAKLYGKEASYDATLMTQDSRSPASDDAMPISPMVYDVAAIQYLYGANRNYHAGNDAYMLDGKRSLDGTDRTDNLAGKYKYVAETVWDGGGTDTLDASSYADGCVIDLREGTDYVTTVGKTQIWNAIGAEIENAKGGAGNDTLRGNNLDNLLAGGKGNDVLTGGKGADMLSGGDGADTFVCISRDDSTEDSMDWIVDFLQGEDKVDLSGLGYGGLRGNFYWTQDDSRTYLQDVDGDFCLAFEGEISFRNGDFVWGAAPEGKTLPTPTEDSSSSASAKLVGGAGSDVLRGTNGDETLKGGTGADLISGGKGADVFAYDSLSDSTSDAIDRIVDFVPGRDKLDFSDLGYRGLGGNFYWGQDGASRTCLIDANDGSDFRISFDGHLDFSDGDFIWA
jgi:Ca2+-binding RTX toxin-like protein